MTIKNKKLILVSLALAIVLIGGGAYAYSKKSDGNNAETAATESTEDEQNPYVPPTEKEQNAGNKAKEKFENQTEENESNDDGVKSVKPEITYADVYQGNVEVSSHVPGVFENSGKCTLKLKKGSKTVTKSRDAVQNVSEMSCGLIKIPTSELSSGNWTATVTYSSAKANGTSDGVLIEVK